MTRDLPIGVLTAAMTTALMSASALAMSTSIYTVETLDTIDPTALHVLDFGATDAEPVILSHPVNYCPEIVFRPTADGAVRVLILVAPLLNRPQCRYFQSSPILDEWAK